MIARSTSRCCSLITLRTLQMNSGSVSAKLSLAFIVKISGGFPRPQSTPEWTGHCMTQNGHFVVISPSYRYYLVAKNSQGNPAYFGNQCHYQHQSFSEHTTYSLPKNVIYNFRWERWRNTSISKLGFNIPPSMQEASQLLGQSKLMGKASLRAFSPSVPNAMIPCSWHESPTRDEAKNK